MVAKSGMDLIQKYFGDFISIDRKGRAKAIEAPMNLDTSLRILILQKFPKRTQEVRKLMNALNLVQKARLAYILNLIDGVVKKDLEQIHEIRNKFAHSFHASFFRKDVLKYVKQLSTAKGQSDEVIEKHSYKLYENAVNSCICQIMDKMEVNDAEVK